MLGGGGGSAGDSDLSSLEGFKQMRFGPSLQDSVSDLGFKLGKTIGPG
jgi:hypothetical protein